MHIGTQQLALFNHNEYENEKIGRGRQHTFVLNDIVQSSPAARRSKPLRKPLFTYQCPLERVISGQLCV